MNDLFGQSDGSVTITLNDFERRLLMSHHDRPCAVVGGFQGLMRKLGGRAKRDSTILLESEDLRRIRQYAEYRSGGGWESDLRAIFQRHLGRNLDKAPNS